MSEADKSRRQRRERVRAAPGHTRNFGYNAAPLENALHHLAPSSTQAAILAAFDNRTTWNTIRDWRRGRRAIPQWARDLLQAKAAAILAAAIESPRGPGMLSGLRNLPHEIRQR